MKTKIFTTAVVPGFAEAAQLVINHMGPEAAMGLAFAGSVATTITKDVGYIGQVPVNTQPRDSGVYEVAIPVNFPAAAPVANDTQALCKLLPGVEVIDFEFQCEDVDTNGTPTAAISVGELNADLADMGVTYQALTIQQTGGLVRHSASSNATRVQVLGNATKGNERIVGLKWTTAAATYAASKKGLLVLKLLG
jgi:hypothetical protein